MPRGVNPHARHATGIRESPERILEASNRDPHDRVLAIAARCIQCTGNPSGGIAEAIRCCHVKKCALHALRPYQLDVPPRSAPHLDRPEPTYEEAQGMEMEAE